NNVGLYAGRAGIYLRAAKPNDAVADCERALALREMLAVEFPGEYEKGQVLRQLAALCAERARVFKEIGRAQEAGKAYHEAEGIHREGRALGRKVIANSNWWEARSQLGYAYESLGQLLREASKREAAIETYGKGLGVWESLVAEFSKEDHRWHQARVYEELGRLRKEIDQ